MATAFRATPVIEAGGVTFFLAFAERKKTGSLREYLPKDETLDSWTRLVAVREFDHPQNPKTYVDNLASQYRAKNPGIQFAIMQDLSSGDWMIDFFMFPPDPQTTKYVEWNFFRARKGKNGIAVFQYAVRLKHNGWVLSIKDQMKKTREESLSFLLSTWITENEPNQSLQPTPSGRG